MKQAENDLLQHQEFKPVEQYSTFWSIRNALQAVLFKSKRYLKKDEGKSNSQVYSRNILNWLCRDTRVLAFCCINTDGLIRYLQKPRN